MAYRFLPAARLFVQAPLLGLVLSLLAPALSAQEAYRNPQALKRLSLEELVDLEITSASRRPERASQAATAIDVVTGEEMRRAGVTNIPDALRLAAGLHVAQVSGNTWAISSRGFNIAIANKMQVLMDGRNLYTPLFSGVFWDVQQTFLPDLQQIEVIRGPGATLWGANAVNGVINITTKSARETQGGLAWAGGGIGEAEFGGIRWGGKLGPETYYRVYFTQLDRDSLKLEWNGSARDGSSLSQGGFRLDSQLTADDLLTLQSDVYGGCFGQFTAADIDVNGGNVLGRWTRELGRDESFFVQTYYDRTFRDVPGLAAEERNTFDVEFQHRFSPAPRHDVIYGLNYRLSIDEIDNTSPELAFLPDHEESQLLSGYIQDEFALVPERLSLIAGTKLEYNTFSGVEVQPSGRFLWTPGGNQTIWGAISRAVRTPTRVDEDVVLPNPATGFPSFLRGSRSFAPEELIAYELGYRIRPSGVLSLEADIFFHDYSNLRSAEPDPDGTGVILRNGQKGESWGGTASATWRIASWWEAEGSVALIQTDVDRESGSQDFSGGTGEANDPNAIVMGRSSMDLPGRLELDAIIRYVDDLPAPATPDYLTVDARLGWWVTDRLEVALVGRNLLDDVHPEMRGGSMTSDRSLLAAREVRRSLYGTIRWQF